MKSTIHYACCAALLTFGVGALHGCASAGPDQEESQEDVGEAEAALCIIGAGDTTTALDAQEQAFLTLLNNHRAANGKSPVAACKSLSRAAQGHSEDMRDNDYFSHIGLDGSNPFERACDACYSLGCGPSSPI